MEDLDARGLLDETLVVRDERNGPHAARSTATPAATTGRSATAPCMAGGGIRGGTVYGESDSQAAYVKDKPVSTADICATIYHCLGIDPELPRPRLRRAAGGDFARRAGD